MLTWNSRRLFGFFNKQISDKYGRKCCRYNQDGKPMAKETVVKTFEELKGFIQGWKISDNYLSLYRYFYTEDYLMAVQYMKDIAKIDALEYKNCPGFELKLGELLKVELLSPSIKGLSQVDFQLAMKINLLKLEDYMLIPLNDVSNYKKEVMKFKVARNSPKIQ